MKAAFACSNGLAPRSMQPKSVTVQMDFSASAAPQIIDFLLEEQFQAIEEIQSIKIDNSNNPGTLTLIFDISLDPLVIPPFAQAVLPIIAPAKSKCTVITPQSPTAKPTLIFLNVPMAQGVWMAVPGLTAPGFAPLAVINGNQNLVAGVPLQTVKLWRGQFEVDAPANLKFTDGNGGTVLFSCALVANGSVNFALSAQPHVITGAGNALVLNSSAAVNLYGGFGYSQS